MTPRLATMPRSELDFARYAPRQSLASQVPFSLGGLALFTASPRLLVVCSLILLNTSIALGYSFLVPFLNRSARNRQPSRQHLYNTTHTRRVLLTWLLCARHSKSHCLGFVVLSFCARFTLAMGASLASLSFFLHFMSGLCSAV